MLYEFVVDLLPCLSNVVDPGTVPNEYSGWSWNLANHCLSAGALQYQVIVAVFFVFESHDGGLNSPNGDFSDSGADIHEFRRILTRILKTRRTRQEVQFLKGGLDDAGAKTFSVDDVLAYFCTVGVLAGLHGPTFCPRLVGFEFRRRRQFRSRKRACHQTGGGLDLCRDAGADDTQSVDVGYRPAVARWSWR